MVLGSLFLAACGNDASDGAACTVPAACGGDVVGSWRVTSACLKESVHDLGCTGATATIAVGKVEGTVVFGSDGTEVSDETITESGRYSFPSACLSAPCSETAAKLEAGDPGLQTTCSLNGDVCGCSFSLVSHTNDHDTFTVSGNSLTTTSGATGTDDVATYCVKGTDFSATSNDGTVVHATKQ